MSPAIADTSVLLVDDNNDLCRIILRLLKVNQITGYCAHSGRDALRWLEMHRPKLVLLDLSMPDISGLDVLRQIRANPALSGLPVVLHSALNQDAVVQAASDGGADGVLLKGRCTFKDVLTVVASFGVEAS